MAGGPVAARAFFWQTAARFLDLHETFLKKGALYHRERARYPYVGPLPSTNGANCRLMTANGHIG